MSERRSILKTIREILATQWPLPRGREAFLLSVGVGVAVAAFLLVFQPFGIATGEFGEYKSLKVAGCGLIAFVCTAFGFVVCPKLFPSYFSDESYTVSRDIVTNIGVLGLIALTNQVYLTWVYSSVPGGSNHIAVNTFLVGGLIYGIGLLLNRSRILRQHLDESVKLNAALRLSSSGEVSAEKGSQVVLGPEESPMSLDLSDLLYVEAAGNYVKIVQRGNGQVKEDLVRSTLKEIEAQIDAAPLIRCHRSFVVNLGQVAEVTGNAQGIRLEMKGADRVVPVSRSYVPAVRGHFAVKKVAA